jgi:signal transduction histidine kinase
MTSRLHDRLRTGPIPLGIAANAYSGNNAKVSAPVRQVTWVAAALVGPAALAAALLPLRSHVNNVLIAVVLMVVMVGTLAPAEWPPRLAAGASAALTFDFFYVRPYDQFAARTIQDVETTIALAVAIPALGAWVGMRYGKEAARERALREQVERLAADLTASRRRIVAAGDETRRRIERNLHDGVQQRLVTISLVLRGVRDGVPDSLPTLRDDLDRLANALAETLEEVRDLARGVHPAILSDAGLAVALRGLAHRSPLPVRLHLHADGRLSAETEATAYYVVSEAFANAVKHASASAVDVAVETGGGALTVRVSDDGAGGADPGRGSGLTGIRDRVEAVGGTLAVHSPPAAGTVLTARLPL